MFCRIAQQILDGAHVLSNHLPSWAATRYPHWNRGVNFRFLETIEYEVIAEAYQFLHHKCNFTSTIWLHDGFWVSPAPTEEDLKQLHLHLDAQFNINASQPPLFRKTDPTPDFQALCREANLNAITTATHATHENTQTVAAIPLRIRRRGLTGIKRRYPEPPNEYQQDRLRKRRHTARHKRPAA